MKILIFESYPNYSGAQKIMLSLAKFIQSNTDYNIQIVLADNNGNGEDIYRNNIKNVNIISAPNILKTYGNESSWFNKRIFLKSIFLGLIPYWIKLFFKFRSSHSDIIYCCDIRGFIMVFVPAIILRKKIIWHVHGKLNINKKLNKILCKLADVVLTPSQAVFESLEYKENAKVLLNGINNPLELVNNKSILKVKKELKNYFIDENSIYLLCVSSFVPQKGLHHAIEALAKLNKQYKLVIVGDCNNESCLEYRKYLDTLIESLHLKDRVYFAGWQKDVYSWILNSYLFIFPTIEKEVFSMNGIKYNIESSEGLPTVLLESSMLGIPSIACNVTGVSEIINKNNGHIILPSSSSEIASSINQYTKINTFDFNQRFLVKNMTSKFVDILKGI